MSTQARPRIKLENFAATPEEKADFLLKMLNGLGASQDLPLGNPAGEGGLQTEKQSWARETNGYKHGLSTWIQPCLKPCGQSKYSPFGVKLVEFGSCPLLENCADKIQGIKRPFIMPPPF